MTHSIDTSFRAKKRTAAARRRRTRRRRIFVGLALLALLSIVLLTYVTTDYWTFDDEDEELEVAEQADDVPADAPVYVPAVVDLAGDPMWIQLSRDSGSEPKVRSIPRPAELALPGISPQIELLSDAMLSSSERFMTTIPSTQEDFAFFQARRTGAAPADGMPVDLPPPADSSAVGGPAAETATFDDPSAGWGETIDAGRAALPEFKKTEIENNTSVASISPESERFESTEDIFVKTLGTRSLDSIVLEARFDAGDAKLASEALKALLGLDSLAPGTVVAMRGYRARRQTTTHSLMQLSIYTRDAFLGSLARNAAGMFVSSVDPWVRNDLFNYSGASEEGTHKRQYRLLDAIYSTAARNNVPTGVIGEAIMYLSHGQDLNAFATEDQRLVLIYSDTARNKDAASSRVLYVGVQGIEKNLECFVFQQKDGDFACFTRDDEVRSLSATNGMVTPVNGVLTSTFGPRRHPILGTVRVHKGVDWMAPLGSPVFAAFDGEIVFQGDGDGYGNLVRISHAGGRETGYAHLQRFALQGAVGTHVKAGEVIGYVGTTGLSTGPHLHFELSQGGETVDPLGEVSVVGSDSSAVETLTDRIIHVESGGSVRAKNPLSSATGLGQFIEKTWVRMMNTYRSDLARALSRDDLLALRFDPTLSREMVRNLAHEGEAYLRAHGHGITAGRLYLCHFLGMEGAHQVLSRPSETMLADFLDPAVFDANPFLRGKSAGYVVNWAERKMSGHTRWMTSQPNSTTTEIRQTSPEFELYKKTITAIVNSAGDTL